MGWGRTFKSIISLFFKSNSVVVGSSFLGCASMVSLAVLLAASVAVEYHFGAMFVCSEGIRNGWWYLLHGIIRFACCDLEHSVRDCLRRLR